MSSNVNPIPDGFHTITPSLIVKDAAKAIEFYKEALGAEEIMRLTSPDGAMVVHSELKIGNSIIFVTDEFPEMNSNSPKTLGGTPVSLYMYVEDADAAHAKATAAGAESLMPVEEMFWGDRFGLVADPFGHTWGFSTHVKELTPEEITKASNDFFIQTTQKAETA